MKLKFYLILLFALFCTISFAQTTAPNISYPGDHAFISGIPITPLAPANSGGAIPATIYQQVTPFAGANAEFSQPFGVATDAAGNIYVADQNHNQIRKITSGGVVSIMAGSGMPGNNNGSGTGASFASPVGVATDAAGNVYVADQGNSRIRKITPTGDVTTLAGSSTFSSPTGIATDAAGNVYVANTGNNLIRKITPGGVVTTLAGSGIVGNTDGNGTTASFNGPTGVATDAAGNVYVADAGNNLIRKISPTGVVTTLAGSGPNNPGSQDGNSTAASFSSPYGVATDAAGNIYVADASNNLIRKITPGGVVTTLAGSGPNHPPGNINATGIAASFNTPTGVATDAAGNVYVADAYNNSIRKITVSGYTISPVQPAGLSFDGATGTISGTPTVTVPPTTYTVTGYNLYGSSLTTFNVNVQATVVNVSSTISNGSYKASQVIPIKVTFSNPVDVAGIPQLKLKTGSTDQVVNYISGSGSTTLTFNYTVQPGDVSAGLDYFSASALTLNGGTINYNGIPALITLPAPGTTGSLGKNNAIVIDTQAPTATITVANTALKSGQTSPVTFTFSEAVTGFDNIDLTVQNANLSNVSSLDGGITWTATLTPFTGTTIANNAITLNNAGVTDIAGNAGSGTTTSNTYAIDNVAPTVTITSNKPTLKTGETATITFTFSEDPGSTFTWNGTTGDVTVSGGTLGAISGTGLTRTATYTPTPGTNNGTASITVAALSYADAAGNGGGAGTTPAINFDTSNPNAPSAPGLSTNSDSGTSSTDNVTNITQPIFTGIAETGSTVILYDSDGTTVIGSGVATGNNWSVTTLANLSEGMHTVTAKATDAAGNTSNVSAAATVKIDTTVPTVSSINTNSSPANATSVSYAVTFSEDVANVDIRDFTLAHTGNAAAVIASVAHTDNKVFTVTVNNITGDGTIGLNLNASATGIIDIAGNNIAGGFTGNTYTFDHTAPTLLSVSITSDNSNTSFAKTGDWVTLNFTSSETITTPVLTIANHNISPTNSGNIWTAKYQMLNTDAEGVVPFSIAYADVAGNTATSVTATTNNTSVTFDKTAPIAPAVVLPVNGTTVFIASNVISGSAEPGSKISVNINGTIVSPAVVANGIGVWAYTTSALTDGSYTVKALATDAAGNTSDYGNSNTFTVNTRSTINATAISALSSTYGVASAAASFTVSGTNITGGVVISPPAGFEVSTDNINFSNTITIGTSGTIAQPAYIRLTGTTAAGTYNGNVKLSSIGATDLLMAIPNSIVNKAPLTVTAAGINKTYNGNTTATVTLTDNRITGDVLSISYGAAFADKNAGVAKVVSVTNIAVSGSASVNYTLVNTTTSTTADITALPLTITANNKVKTYGQVLINQTGSSAFTSLGLVGAETIGSVSVTYGTGAPATAPVNGNYAGSVTASAATGGTFNANNYTISYVNGDITIQAAPLTITANNKVKTYGQVLTNETGSSAFTSLGLVGTETIGSVSVSYGTGAAATAPVNGNYTGSVTTSAAIGGTFNANNYTINYVNGDITIQAAPLTITAKGPLKPFGTALSAITTNDNSYFDVSATQNNEVVSSLTLTPNAAGVSAGTTAGQHYLITPSNAAGTGFLAGNYNITYLNYEGIVQANNQTITFNPLASITYGDAAPDLSGVTASSGLPVTFSSSNPNVATINGSIITILGAGTTTITASQGGSGNYTPATAVQQSLVVNAKPLTITANNKVKTYGQVLTNETGSSAFTQSGLVGAETIGNVSVAYGAGAAATAPVNGNYAGSVTASAATGGTFNANNYTINYVNGDITIQAASLTITANNKIKTYGQVLTNETGSSAFTSLGLVGAETIGSVSVAYGAGAAATAPVNGNYTGSVTAGAATGGTFTPNNYNINYVAGNIIIEKALLTIIANDKTKTYGDADPALTYQITSGTLMNGDAFTGVLTRDAGESIGAYTVKQGTLTLNSNYNLNYATANLTITPMAITISADAKTKNFSDADPAFTYQITSGALANGDAFTGALTRDAGENAGTYMIKRGTLALNGNYALNYATANFTIKPMAITVSADAKTKLFGSADPVLSYQITSGTLANGDAFTGALTRDAGESVGTYAIRQGTLALNNNYIVNYAGANIYINASINRAVTFSSLPSKTYGDADFALSATVSTGEKPVYSSSDANVATIVNGMVHITGAGSVIITAAAPPNGDYNTILPASQLLIINKAAQKINFAAIPDQLKGSTYNLSEVSSTSGLPVTITSDAPMVVSITDQKLNSLSIGTANITASQPGNANYLPAANVIQSVKVLDITGNDVVVHPALSTNGDGMNDVLHIEGIADHPDNHVVIINRNGVKIYEANGYNNTDNVFDGRSNITGAMQLQGTYYYVIELDKDTDHKRRLTGYFILKY